MRLRQGSRAVAMWCALVAAILFSAMQPAHAAVAVDAQQTGTKVFVGNTPGTLTFNLTTAGSNRLLIVAISLNAANSTSTVISTVTYGSSSLTLINADETNNRRVEFWALYNPPSGTATVTITPTAVSNKRQVGVVASAIEFTGTDSSVPYGTPAFNGGNSTAPSVTIASNPNQLVLDTVAATGAALIFNTTITPGAGQTQQWTGNSNGGTGNDVAGSGSTETGASSVTMSDTLNLSTQWEIGAIPIYGAATGILCATPGKDGVGSVTGVVNSYYAPSAGTILTPGSSNVTLAAGAGSGSDINAGDLLMIMQMQDAGINSTNTSAYGAGTTTGSGYTALNSAGLYEYVIANNSVTFASGGALSFSGTGAGGGVVNTYTEAAATGTAGQSTFQIIRVPQYSSATLGNGASNVAVANAWDGTVGGVFAIDVTGKLTLNGTVNVDALGFRGGGGRRLTGGTGAGTDYRTLATVNNNSAKGEGIAGTPHYVISGGALVNTGVEGYPNGSNARGAPGTAGGGGTDSDPAGNSENTGGGGGGNGGAGGMGGNSWNANLAEGGFGGVAFPATVSQVTMGGGGGAGTTNNGTEDGNNDTSGIASSGGTGGGLVVIRTSELTGTGTITANGGSPLSTQNDGAGGGGAGGTVVVVAQHSGLTGLTVNAVGGNGGNAWPGSAPGTPCPGGSACNYHGPGGGGGGGVVLLSSAAASTNVSGGANGTTTTAAVAYGATTGSAGVVSTSATLAGMGGVSSGSQCVPDLTISGAGLTALVRGNTWNYNLTVSNLGIESTTGLVTVNDPLPAGFAITNASGTGWSCGETGQNVTCTRSDALAGFSAMYPNIMLAGTVLQSAPDMPTNTATTSGGGESYLGNDSVTVTPTITSSADLSLTTTASPTLVAASGALTWTQTVTNSGPSDSAGLSFTSIVPANTAFQSITIPSGWSCTTPAVGSAGTISCVATYLPAGSSATFSVVTSVNSGVSTGTILTNTASVNAFTSDPYAFNNFTTTSVTVGTAAQSDLAISDVAAPTTAKIGQQVTFTHLVTYTGTSSASSVTYTEALPANTTLVTSPTAAGWTCSGTTTFTCTIASLASGVSATFTTVVQITGGTTITDTASIASVPADSYAPNNSATANVTVTATTGTDLSVTDQASPTSVEAGNNIVFSHTVTNIGPNTSGAVTLTDTLPAGTTFQSYTAPAGWSCANASNVVTCTASGLAVSSAATIQVTTLVPSTVASGTVETDTVTVSSTGDPVSGNNTASASATVVQGTDLGVTISGSPDPVSTAGGALAITANVTNNGPTHAGNSTFQITIPANTTYSSLTAPAGWTCGAPAAGSVLCTISDLAVGYNQNFVLNLTVGSLAAGTAISSTATVIPTIISDKIPGNNSASFSTVVAAATQVDLAISLASSPVPVYAGSTLTIAGSATNKGPAAAANPSLVFNIPAGTTLSSYSVPGAACTQSGSTLTCTAASIPANLVEPVQFVLNVASSDTTPITATATVSSTTPGPGGAAATATASVTTPVVTSADLSVSDSCTADQQANMNITCTQVITNLGPSDAQGVMLAEAQPANTTGVSASGPAGVMCSRVMGGASCNVGTVAVGSPVTITYVTKINTGTARGTKITDTVSVTTTTTDPVSTNNTASASTTVASATDADVAITDAASVTTVAAGSNITYTQKVTNNGPAGSGTVTVSETVPANATYVSAAGTGWTCAAPSGGAFTCTSTGIAAGSSQTISFIVTANSGTSAGTVITDSVTASGTAADPDSSNNSATASTSITDPNQADMAVTISAASNSPRSGTSDTFTITATNNGPNTATNAIVTIPLPNLEQFVSATPGQGSCSLNGDNVVCALGTLASGANSTISLLVNAINYGETTNTASVIADQTDTNTSNNTASTAMLILAPTDVKLVSFDAQWNGTQVVLKWRTGKEARNLGFNVYREFNGERVKLNPSLIAGSAVRMRSYLPQHTASDYQWIDWSPVAGASYWLEDVTLSGARTPHGPVQASSTPGRAPLAARAQVAHSALLSSMNPAAQGAPMPATVIAPAPSDATKAADTTISPQPIAGGNRPSRGGRTASSISSAVLAGVPAVKISINHEGWYRVTQAQLAAAGLDTNANVNALRLITEGAEIPMRITTDNGNLSAIEFYGIGLDNQYTDTRVYWLIWQPNVGARLGSIDGTNTNLPITPNYAAEAVRHDRTFYFAGLTTNGDQDNFFGDLLTGSPLDEHLELNGVDSNAGTTQLDITLQGVTDPAAHDVQVALNGTSVGEITFTDMGRGALVTSVPSSLLKEGDNVVTLTPLGGDSDVTAINHVIVTYGREYLVENNALRFTLPGQSAVKLTGFSNSAIHVVDIDASMADVKVTVAQEADGTYSAAFGNRSVSPAVYYAYTDSAIAAPIAVTPHAPVDLISSANAADLLIVSHSSFIPALAPLVAKRQSEGLKVKVVDIDDVYSNFNYGEHTPLAVQQLLQAATSNWSTAPRWLLLVGDASVDPRNFLGLGSYDFVPTKVVATEELKTASDAWFSDFDGTGYERIATGRLPVRTPEEAATVVNKILAYGDQTAGTWSQSAYLVADQNIGADFQAESSTIASQLPATLNVTSLNVSDTTSDRAALLAQLNAGNLIVNYLGHGSENDWASPGFFNNDDAQSLTNGSMAPFVIDMDCLNGLFHDVYETSLASSLLLAPQGGAIAVWASSGVTDSEPQFGMDKALMQYLFATPAQTIGEATRNAKQGVADIDVRRTWILFGDPSMKLKSVTGN